MKKKFTFLMTAMALILAIMGPRTVAWGQETATITFANQTTGTSDGNTAYTTSNFVSDGIASSDAAFGTITCSATEKCYSGKIDHGLKAGASSNAGNFTISFSSLSNVSKIVLNRASYNNSKTATITVKNGETTLADAVPTPSGTDAFSDMVIDNLNITSLSTLTVNTSKYCYIKSITITYSSGTTPTVAAPTFTPAAGTYYEDKTIELFAEEGCTIHYTLDGSTPDNESTLYEDAIQLTVPSTTTIKAIAVDGEGNSSNVASATYTLKRSQYTPAQLLDEVEPDGQQYTVVFTNEIIKSFYVYNHNNAGFYIETTEGDFLVYKSGTPSNWEVGGKISGTVTAQWKYYNSLKEFCPTSYDDFSYTPPTQQLPTPTGLEVSNLSMTGATLSWDAVEHASSYTVYVTGGDDYEETFGPTTNSLVLDNLTPGTAYLWTVKAIGDGVTYLDSEESELAQFDTPTTVIYNINFETQQTGGTIEIEYEQAAAGKYVSAIATADYHYSFTRWNFSPAVTIYDGEDTDYNIIFIMPESDVTVTATFTEDTKYTVTYAKGGDDVTGEDPETVSYYENDEVTLEENPYTRTGFTFNGWQVKDAEENDVTVDEGMFEMPASNVTVTATWAGKTQYTVTYRALGAQIGTEQVYDGDLCANVPEVTNTPTGWTFFGWTTESANQTTTAPEPFNPTTNPVIEDIILNAVFTKTEGETSWDETELDDLTSSDVFVMVGTNNKLLQNNNKTAVSATIEDGQVTTAIIDDYKWNVTEEDGSYVFNANGSTNVLYFTNDNNGVKFGTPQSSSESTKYFTQNNNGYLVGTDGTNTRYLSYYSNNNDWRCYKNLDNNPIAMKFYKLNTGTTYYTTVVPASEYAIAIDENIQHGTIEVENALTAAAAETEITLIVTPEEHYSLAANSLTVTGASSATVEVTPVPGEVVKYTFLMPAEAVTITAQFTENPKFAVSCYANGTSVSTEQVYAGVMQLPVSVTAPNGYTFVGWTNQQISGVAESATYFSSYNVTEDVDLYAVFAIAETGGTTSVTKDIIVEAGITATQTLNQTAYQIGDLPIQLTATKGSSNWPVINYNATSGNDLRFYKSSSSVTFATTNNSTITKIEFKKNASTASTLGDAFSANVGTLSANVWTGSAESVTISYSADATFKEQMYIINVTYSETVPSTYSNFCTTVNDLSGNVASQTYEGAYYIAATSAGEPAQINDLVTINGALGNADPALLIINDGGQLIHHNAGVAATVKKNITGYGENTQTRDGYYLIANPTARVANDEYDALEGASSGIDVYTFDPKEELEWRNQAGTASRIPFTRTVGYLFASAEDRTMSFRGSLLPAGEATIDDLKYYDGNEAGHEFPGFNLIGNPFACNAYVQNYSFYTIEGDAVVAGTGAIAPCQGFMIETDEDKVAVELTTQAPEPAAAPSTMSIEVNQNRGNVIDRAIVRFDGANDMHKFMLNPDRTNIRLAKNGEEFAAVSTEAEGELPVNFKAEKNGTYTISVNTENVEANYLHLIDNLTGMDTDLLSTPSYTFNATTSDYASRFKLVFSMNDVESNQVEANSFAFINNGEIVISNEGRATLQVIDVMGRIISSEEINGEARISTNGLTAGVYVLNLNGNVQKIVVR